LYDSSINQNLVTYAQNREDIFLFALIGHVEKGVYIDIGAHHPTFHSVTKLFYDRGWTGLNVEANPLLIDNFTEFRPKDTNIAVGISNRDGQMTFREYPGALGLSSVHEGVKAIHEATHLAYRDLTIEVATLAKVFTEHQVSRIDFLKIDVEGHEVEVLEGNDWVRWRPSVILAEAIASAEITKFLSGVGYKFEFFDGLNNYYVEKSATGITMNNYSERILRFGFQVGDHAPLPEHSEPAQNSQNLMGVRGSLQQLLSATKHWSKTKRKG
jgi:FkbM family methyltransferase